MMSVVIIISLNFTSKMIELFYWKQYHIMSITNFKLNKCVLLCLKRVVCAAAVEPFWRIRTGSFNSVIYIICFLVIE